MPSTATFMKDYMIGLRPYIIFVIFLFMGSVLAGYFIAHNYDKETEELLNEMKKMFMPAKEYSQLQTFMFIFENNITALTMSLIFSMAAGISSLLVVIANGIILGVFAVVISNTISTEYLISGILPHGTFEIPALILTSAIGLRIGVSSLSKLAGAKMNLSGEIAGGLKFYVLIVIPLLLVAALVEAFVTPVILSYF